MSYKLHECEKIPEGIQIIYSNSSFSNEKYCWSLVIQKEVQTEEDLNEYQYLEEIGDTVWETTLEILNCPFCGEKLADKLVLAGKFRCFEHVSGWYGRVL